MLFRSLGLKELLHTPVRQLSLGQKMRCEIAAAFLHNPKIVYLDEPTIGLDFMVKEKIRKFIKQLNKDKNTTVILTTHDLQDIEEICSRIIIIDKGSIMFDGALDAIREEFSKFQVASILVKDITPELKDYLDNHDIKFEVLSIDEDNKINIKFNRDEITIAGMFDQITTRCIILDLNIQDIAIDTIVKTLYERQAQNQGQ